MHNSLKALALATALWMPGIALGTTVQAEAGQSTTDTEKSSTLTGTVKDPTGAVIPGATVLVRDSSGKEQKVVADSEGKFTVSGMAAGPIVVTIQSKGFSDVVQSDIVLAPGKASNLDSVMNAAGENTVVNVEAQRAAQVELQNSEVSGTISQREIVSFGLNGRNFSSLITLAPGVSNQTNQDEAKVGVVGSAKFSVNGGRTEYNNFDVDGSDVLNTDIAASHGHSTLLVYPSVDAIQEMKVLTSNYGAEYGRSASGTVLVTTKSGGEKAHGNAYEFFRNEALNARNYFDQPGRPPLYRRNDFGATFGGPLFIKGIYEPKNIKTHFFLSEEFRREQTPVEFNQGVPSDAERGYNLATQSYGSIADFSDVCPVGVFSFSTSKYPDCPGQGFGGTRDAYQNNQFYIDPNATALLNDGIIPRANASSGCNSSIGSCFVGSVSPSTEYREDLVRLDHDITANNHFYLTGIHDHWQTVAAVPPYANNPNSFPSVLSSFLGPGYSVIAHLTSVITPTFLNDFSVGATWQRVVLENEPGAGVNLNRQSLYNVADPLGNFFNNCYGGEVVTNYNCVGGKLPGVLISGTNSEYGGAGFSIDPSFEPWFSTRGVGTFTDNLSKFAGNHTYKFGAQWTYARRHEFGAANGANSGDVQGLLTFRNVSNINTTGNAFADFEYNNSQPVYNAVSGGDNLYAYQQDSAQTTYRVEYWTVEPYFQDDWKVRPNLTVNLGLRLSIFENWSPEGNQVLYNWDESAFNANQASAEGININPLHGYLQYSQSQQPVARNTTNLDPVLTNGLVQCGAHGVSASCQSSHLWNPAPRLGFAWDPRGNGKTSIRGGYGIFFEHGTGSEANVGSLMGNPPQVLSMTEQNPANYASIGAVGYGTANVTYVESPLNFISIPTKTKWPYIQQWSFGVQTELDSGSAISVAYVGSKGTKLAVAEQINQLPPVPGGSNPFGLHDPITQDICLNNQIDPTNLQDPNAFFTLADGTVVSYGQNPAAFTGLVAACSGTPGNGIHPSLAYSLNFLRPFQGVGNVNALRNSADSIYHSAQITYHHEHHSAPNGLWKAGILQPLDLNLTYTYSHSIDTASDRFSSTFVDSYNLRANRASSDFDERHLFNASYFYELPLVRLTHLAWSLVHGGDEAASGSAATPAAGAAASGTHVYNGPSHLARAMLSHWQLSGITLLQTGTPFSVINGASQYQANCTVSGTQDCAGISVVDNAGLALGLGADSYPDKASPDTYSCITHPTNANTIGPVIGNPCRYVAPRGLTQGSAGRNSENNPGRFNTDLALYRDFKVFGEDTLQFRAEAFNVFNHTQFVIFDPTKGNTASNTITSYNGMTTANNPFDENYSAATDNAGNGFLHPVEAHRPRTVQFGVKLQF